MFTKFSTTEGYRNYTTRAVEEKNSSKYRIKLSTQWMFFTNSEAMEMQA